ncbi:hypothetical protein AARAC_003675 [Aspergillus arachidicola]|uniref:Uncharacterized protein n=1 Tax=Aspergillus arachidicola TaxID=656916 RepID=A0A2G7FMM9_9EURO|nr:hypothetical protein AARAC_003675 [Aspergillus arachidicola]
MKPTGKMHDDRPSPATISPVSTYSPEDHSVDSNDQPIRPKSSVPLKRSVYVVYLTLLYGAAALYAWVIICILVHRPIGGKGYGNDASDSMLTHPGDGTTMSEDLDASFSNSERHLRAARIVQSLVSMLTIPLTSAVCSQAAVVYLQQRRGDSYPTLRQSMALADKGWTDIGTLTNLVFGSWKKYKSGLLLFAIFLHLLGAAISPTQQIFLSFQTIKRTTGLPVDLAYITDFTDLFPASGGSGTDDGLDETRLRLTLASTVNTDIQPRLWSSSTGTVSRDDKTGDMSYSPFQTKSQNTLANITTIADPFWAELPSGTNTGLVRQFAPRINSTAIWENNSTAVLPENCNPDSDAFYLRYEYNASFSYTVEICMPGNMSQSPWENQRSRQDITEELYFKMNFSEGFEPQVTSGQYSTKLTLHTTTGYFELPNYENGQVPGPLIENSPFGNSSQKLASRDLDSYTAWNILHATSNASNVQNKGPLLNIAMALFGEGSFADVQHTTLAAYANSGIIYRGCIDLVPFITLLDETYHESPTFYPCLTGTYLESDARLNHDSNATLHADVAMYFLLFSGVSSGPSSERVQNAFTSAAFLANDMLMTNNFQSQTISISYDMGADVPKPDISRGGIIFVSILLGLYLICLLALALYSAWIPRWTKTLDSFAMLRIGASISERTPLLATQHVEGIKSLDETPGWMGNASEGEVGVFCLGGERPLAKTRVYAGYNTDYVAQTTGTSKPPGPIKRGGYSLV